MGELLAILLGGLIVGGLARLVAPNQTRLGCAGTMAVGIAGGVVGGLIGTAAIGADVQRPLLSLVFSVLGAVLLLLTLDAIAGRRR